MKKLRLTAFFLDAFVLAICWPFSWQIRQWLGVAMEAPINPLESYLSAWPMVVILGLAAEAALGQFRNVLDNRLVEGAVRMLKALLLNLLLVAALGFFFKEFDFGRVVVLNYVLLLALILPAAHGLLFWYASRLQKAGELDKRTLIVGAGNTGIRTYQRLEDAVGSGYRVLGFLDDVRDDSQWPRPWLGTLSDLRKVVENQRIDEVVLAIPSLDRQRQMSLIMELEDLPVEIQVVSTLFGVLASNEQVGFLGEIPVFRLPAPVQRRPLYEASRRLVDIVLASTALLLTFPVWLLVGIAIRLDSPGSVFFVQERVGRYQKNFRMFKFRTMRSDTDPYAEAPRQDLDPRITRLGRFLRRSSLDELPQLLNVLNGTMSLVGPRPEMPFIVATYEPWQKRRLDVVPGITGLWQIVGRKDLPLHENLEYDFYYIRHRSLLLDIVILLKTIPAALWQKGAY